LGDVESGVTGLRSLQRVIEHIAYRHFEIDFLQIGHFRGVFGGYIPGHWENALPSHPFAILSCDIARDPEHRQGRHRELLLPSSVWVDRYPGWWCFF
jgi:hypothetical protein